MTTDSAVKDNIKVLKCVNCTMTRVYKNISIWRNLCNPYHKYHEGKRCERVQVRRIELLHNSDKQGTVTFGDNTTR